MLHPEHPEVALVGAIIATIQFILICSLGREPSIRGKAPTAPFALVVLDYAAPKPDAAR